MEYAGEVDVDDLLPGVERIVRHGRARSRDTGICDQDVRAAQGAPGLRRRPLDGLDVGHVNLRGVHLALGCELADGVGQCIGIPVPEADARAGCQEPFGDGPTDALGTPSDNGAAAVQIDPIHAVAPAARTGVHHPGWDGLADLGTTQTRSESGGWLCAPASSRLELLSGIPIFSSWQRRCTGCCDVAGRPGRYNDRIGHSLTGGDWQMSRMSLLNSPLLLGFDQFERALDRVTKASSDGYPPYNIEQLGEDRLRITLAVAGFSNDELSVQVEDNQLIVRGKQIDDKDRVYLHRGIAARQFQRSFVLADGLEVSGATLDSGLLDIELKRPIPAARVKTIAIRKNSGKKARTLDVSPERGDD